MSRRGVRRRERRQAEVPQSPWRRLSVPFAPLEVLSPEQLETVHDRALGILETLGLEILSADSAATMAAAGCDVERREPGALVRFPRALVEGLIAKAPTSIRLHARNPAHDVVLGGREINFATVSGPPNASDLDRGRRPGSVADQSDLIRLGQMLNSVHLCASPPVEAMELPAGSRHLDVSLSFATLTDKCWGARAIGRRRVEDSFEINRLSRGLTREEAFERPGIIANINVNSPRRVDKEMLGGLHGLVENGQPVVVTPFTLCGAMSPVTLAGALVQQHAEAMGVLAYVQMVRPGAAMVYGGFTSNVDMKSGAPVFGSPEYVRAVLAGGQLARRLGLPYRSSNVNASNAVDAQAAYESLMSLWAVVLGHVNLVWHGHGWLEGGLVASFEKMVLDSEMIAMMGEILMPLKIDDDELGLDALAEVPPGGHFFGTGHTLARYDTAFYAPMISDWRNFEAWTEAGAPEAALRANRVCRRLLETYEPPPMEPDRREALDAFVARRKEEIAAKGLE
jgi:trimethylamine--corrinoid protein Co-methyltransferase